MGRKCMLGWDIIPLLCRSSQHWGEVFLHHNPTSTVRPCACRRSLLCVMLWLYFSGLVSFWKNRQIEHSNFKGKYTTLFCKRVLRTWEKEDGGYCEWFTHQSKLHHHIIRCTLSLTVRFYQIVYSIVWQNALSIKPFSISLLTSILNF